MTRKKLGILIAVFSLAAAPACAKEWTVDYGQSRLGFTGTQGSTSFTGGFKKFTASIDFDPSKPEAGKIAATIDIASAYAGSAERDGALPGSDWFDTSKFPQAQFVSTAIKPDVCNVITPASVKLVGCYKASGTLTIKGITKPVMLLFDLTQKGDVYTAHGSAALIRTDFGIGQGQWSDETYVKHAVEVNIDIVAKPTT